MTSYTKTNKHGRKLYLKGNYAVLNSPRCKFKEFKFNYEKYCWECYHSNISHEGHLICFLKENEKMINFRLCSRRLHKTV